jgi:hypothetical protein
MTISSVHLPLTETSTEAAKEVEKVANTTKTIESSSALAPITNKSIITQNSAQTSVTTQSTVHITTNTNQVYPFFDFQLSIQYR